MKPLYCSSAGKARVCSDCRHNPLNQVGESKGQTINPPIKRDLKCPQFSMLLKPLVRG